MNVKKICAYAVATFLILTVAFRLVAGEGFESGTVTSQMVREKAVTPEILTNTVLEQVFVSECDRITELTLLGTNYGKNVDDELRLTVLDGDGQTVASAGLNTAGLPDSFLWSIPVENSTGGHRGEMLTLQVTSVAGSTGNAVSLFYGDTVSAGKYELDIPVEHPLSVDGDAVTGQLCLSVRGESRYPLARYYWHTMAALLVLLLLFCWWMIDSDRRGRSNLILRLLSAATRYRFLLKQLVQRDFKTKYKRSILGVLWSFMNPLLTMMVMYIVFSTLFKSNIVNFPVYLLTGIVCWNFFSEVTGSCLTSITGNTALITKVYVPKYMYPLSRAISSTVNLGLSLIPLVIVMLLTGTRLTVRILLLPFPILCLFLFSFGMGLLLASMMVFFRDTQFLWGVISMLWMYLTPIFYDAEIIPVQYMTLYKMNPLYHIIRIMRILLINGVSPEPKAYLLCAAVSLIPLFLGALVFKKAQDRFVLYL